MLAIYADHFNSRISDLAQQGGWVGFVAENVPQHWRPDAQLFLISNLMIMVVEPVIAARNVEADDFVPLLLQDIAAIIALSEVISAQRDREYISATSVAMALGQLAPELATTALQVWGPDEPSPAPQTQTA